MRLDRKKTKNYNKKNYSDLEYNHRVRCALAFLDSYVSKDSDQYYDDECWEVNEDLFSGYLGRIIPCIARELQTLGEWLPFCDCSLYLSISELCG